MRYNWQGRHLHTNRQICHNWNYTWVATTWLLEWSDPLKPLNLSSMVCRERRGWWRGPGPGTPTSPSPGLLTTGRWWSMWEESGQYQPQWDWSGSGCGLLEFRGNLKGGPNCLNLWQNMHILYQLLSGTSLSLNYQGLHYLCLCPNNGGVTLVCCYRVRVGL